jgi:hypothetical protein
MLIWGMVNGSLVEPTTPALFSRRAAPPLRKELPGVAMLRLKTSHSGKHHEAMVILL